MSIRQLPEDVVDKIKSSVTVTSLNAVACGLLRNAFDAGAYKANIYLDYTRGNCTVEDNGRGILPDEFKPDGGLGKVHHTSRYPPSSQVHGKHGDFLAYLSTLSLLSVVSHHHQHVSHNSVAIHNSKLLTRHLPCPPEQKFHTFDHGTRVSVRDLFGSMPVRVKQRAVLASDRLNLDKEWGRLVNDVLALLLAWPPNVTIVIRESTLRRELRLKPSESADSLPRTSRLLTQAALSDSGDAESWIPVSASSGQVRVSGCISLNPVATRRAQFLSFGIQPITNDYGTNVLYEEVNKVFGTSSFGVVETADQNDARSAVKARKGIERWPMFCLQVLLPFTEIMDADEILDGQQQDITVILDLLRAVCYGFLKKHHLRPRKVQMSKDKSVFSTSTTLNLAGQAAKRIPPRSSRNGRSHSPHSVIRDAESTRSDSPFHGWHRIKVGRPTNANAIGKVDSLSRLDDPQYRPKKRLVGNGGKLLCKPFEESSPEPDHFSNTEQADVAAFDSANTLGQAESQPEQAEERTGHRSVLEKRPKTQPSPWLDGVLRSWENPVFETAQSSIPRAYYDSSTTILNVGSQAKSHRCGGNEDEDVMFESGSITLDGRVSKAMLSEAEVISQVDRKFILVKLPLSPKGPGRAASTLVILDQHAVDERCRLEDLMANYFDHDIVTGALRPAIEVLERPLIFEVSEKEVKLFDQYREHFGSWGIVYCAQSNGIAAHTPKQGALKVTVTGLPPSILERCKSEPRLLVDLIREEIWKLHEEGTPSRRPGVDASEHGRTANFHGCPRGILELLHSRSCRSAIMFNDVLSKDDCEKLVRRVARCAFPFQCAHGRPTMAPLVDLGSGGRIGEWREEDGDRLEAWQSWGES